MIRIIAHVDMDAFYASVEQREDRKLRGKPVIVGGTPQQRGVVAAASYEARAFGARSAMATSKALHLCPHATLVAPRMSYYKAVSAQIFEIFQAVTPLVEPLSLDEAFLDLSHKVNSFPEAQRLAQRIKAQVLHKTQLTCSVGVAPNKFLSKLASEQNKPNGLFMILPAAVDDFLDHLPLSKLWGVGPATHRRLEQMGIQTVRQLRASALNALVRQLGSQGALLWKLAHGQDERAVVPDRPYKSLSRETTFAEDLTDPQEMKTVLKELCEATVKSLKRHGLQGRIVHLKVRLADFTTLTRNATLNWPTQDEAVVWRAVEQLFDQRLHLQGRGVRLLGAGMAGLSECNSGQLALFAADELVRG